MPLMLGASKHHRGGSKLRRSVFPPSTERHDGTSGGGGGLIACGRRSGGRHSRRRVPHRDPPAHNGRTGHPSGRAHSRWSSNQQGDQGSGGRSSTTDSRPSEPVVEVADRHAPTVGGCSPIRSSRWRTRLSGLRHDPFAHSDAQAPPNHSHSGRHRGKGRRDRCTGRRSTAGSRAREGARWAR
eukprot:scaffold231016_cov33-Tisochrysis_lutea.AAC.1